MKWLLCLFFLVGCTATSPRQQVSSAQPQPLVPEQPTVRIEGFVKHPGEYPWHQYMTIGDLITRAGGPTVLAGRIQFHRGSMECTYDLPQQGDRLWNQPILEGETVTVVHKKSMQSDSY